jgi:hypothetical protein
MTEIRVGETGKVKVVVQKSTFKGVERLDVRQYVDINEDGNFIPTKKGLSIPMDDIGLYVNAIMVEAGLK